MTASYWESLHPFSAGGAYVNFMMEEGRDRVMATYRDNYARLVEVKSQHDPDNVFRVNQNIRPASWMPGPDARRAQEGGDEDLW